MKLALFIILRVHLATYLGLFYYLVPSLSLFLLESNCGQGSEKYFLTEKVHLGGRLMLI